jgi:hypothetical protein
MESPTTQTCRAVGSAKAEADVAANSTVFLKRTARAPKRSGGGLKDFWSTTADDCRFDLKNRRFAFSQNLDGFTELMPIHFTAESF